jgi:hypothetical protein
VIAERHDPYFDRTWRHFSSHAQTPVRGPSGRPAAVRAGRVAYLAFPVFRCYLRYANRPYKLLVRNALARLLPQPLVRTDAPSTARITLLEQKRESRLVAHLLHYVPERRTKRGVGGADEEIDVIEDVIPLYDVRVEIRGSTPPRAVTLAPQGSALPLSHADGYTRVAVPRVDGYQAVVIQR